MILVTAFILDDRTDGRTVEHNACMVLPQTNVYQWPRPGVPHTCQRGCIAFGRQQFQTGTFGKVHLPQHLWLCSMPQSRPFTTATIYVICCERRNVTTAKRVPSIDGFRRPPCPGKRGRDSKFYRRLECWRVALTHNEPRH